MLDDDKPKDGQLNPEGWEEYATPQSPNHNWAIERDDFETNYALAHEFKAFMEENFIKESNSPALSKGAQIIIDAVEKLPLVFKNDDVLKLSKLKELKAQSEDSYVDFTNKYTLNSLKILLSLLQPVLKEAYLVMKN